MHPRRHDCRTRPAFTLVELLVTVLIISILIGLLVPVLGQVRDAAQRTTCLSNVRQLTVAVNTFSAGNGSRLPENRSLVSETEYVTWRRRFAETGLMTSSDGWKCPRHPDPGPRGEGGYVEDGIRCVGDISSSYALNGHVLWRLRITDDDARRADTVIQRPSHTILIAETNRAFADLRASPPIVANYYGDNPGPYGYWHEGDGVYGFQDGHVETLGLLETGSPDCRWHNGRDLTDDPFVPQNTEEIRPHEHEDWQYLVPSIYSGTN